MKSDSMTPSRVSDILTPLFHEQRTKIRAQIETEQRDREKEALGEHSGISASLFFKKLELPAFCQKVTGEPNLTVLRMLFKYFNHNGRLVELTLYNSEVRKRVAKAMELTEEDLDQEEEVETSRKGSQKLSVWEQFVLFMVIFTYCRDTMTVASALFDVHESTARWYYITYTIAMFPTAQQAAKCTPERTKVALDLHDNIALYIGDCTGEKIELSACVSNDLYSAAFSEYKNCTTVKHNVISCGNTYVRDITKGYCGASTDNGIHNNELYGSRMRCLSSVADEVAKTIHICYLYDKGLTDSKSLLISVYPAIKSVNGWLAFTFLPFDRLIQVFTPSVDPVDPNSTMRSKTALTCTQSV
ncbi:hypothetical protein SARC_04470 [Sphaeroforma arctica JP610]|uniref:Uncharacterized protein n=1 Tax=Sphaeroforma arctica JP610 TaxID=667725 RepID=A0A0L0G341_9EUKA|nr:hypothetical protein SARC_04470 [Sphaeroforma arctica JP610]KNC83274.1 hypothetical protein SARC_04470 [Sphaeroforma arctica JP610]|eukprot:XP_014157176.1 hypothetical protein SARC_04470 [Sphaeroforma arctica JP610]